MIINYYNLLIIFFSIVKISTTIKWLGLSNANVFGNFTHQNNCSSLKKYLNKMQIKFCRTNLELMPLVQTSTLRTINSCSTQFSMNRWNCSNLARVPKLTNDLTHGTREQAYVYSLAAASFIYEIAKKCGSNDGSLKCGCGKTVQTPSDSNDRNNQIQHVWGGCSDNFEYGYKTFKAFISFLDHNKRHGKSTRHSKKIGQLIFMNKHNYMLGYQVIKSNVEVKCKCHGVSASCNVKTCWQVVPSFDVIAQKLKEKYTKAIQIQKDDPFDGIRAVDGKKIGHESMIYMKRSPDYCKYDHKTGSFGTYGRKCYPSVRNHSIGTCSYMCCGRGYITFNNKKVSNCNCKFIYCCQVKCQECVEWVEESYCL